MSRVLKDDKPISRRTKRRLQFAASCYRNAVQEILEEDAEYLEGRPVVSVEMRKHMLCPFPPYEEEP